MGSKLWRGIAGRARRLGPNLWPNFRSDRAGATAIEYALIASLISIVILLAVALIGSSTKSLFTSVANTLN